MFTSCFHSDYIQGSYTPLSSSPCTNSANRIYLFFEGEIVDFQYEKTGMVEVDGAQYSNDQQLLSQLKYKAWNNCANGVINIKKSFKVRELSTTGSDGKKKHLFFNCIYRTGSENKDRFYFFKEVR